MRRTLLLVGLVVGALGFAAPRVADAWFGCWEVTDYWGCQGVCRVYNDNTGAETGHFFCRC